MYPTISPPMNAIIAPTMIPNISMARTSMPVGSALLIIVLIIMDTIETDTKHEQ